jgi:flagellar hook-basal body complex protein FliE
MIVPPVGGLTGGLSEALTKAGAPGQAEGLSQGFQANGGTDASAEPASFGSALTEAVSSLEKTQQSSDAASQALATGNVKDPEAAVVTVEDAQLAMQLAAQIRTKATEAVQTIFQTQV